MLLAKAESVHNRPQTPRQAVQEAKAFWRSWPHGPSKNNGHTTNSIHPNARTMTASNASLCKRVMAILASTTIYSRFPCTSLFFSITWASLICR